MSPITVILASKSPRRTQLLSDAGVPHIIHAVETDESLEPDLAANPQKACGVLAERKAQAAANDYLANNEASDRMVFIGSDTMVVEGNEIFGKPADDSDAYRMLERLSGKTHHVMTSVCLLECDTQGGAPTFTPHTFVDISDVTFHKLDALDILEYLACGESSDKAGAYAIQGEGRRLVEKFEGDWDTIVGMPVERMVKEYPQVLGLE